jgi:hypothetical protein
MTITFENDSDVIIYALEKIILFARENQYLFLANCAWWIASTIGLDEGLVIHIDNLVNQNRISNRREVSATPRDIAREVSPELPSSNYITDPLRRNRSGRINPLPQTKKQRRKANKIKRLQKAAKKPEVKKE